MIARKGVCVCIAASAQLSSPPMEALILKDHLLAHRIAVTSKERMQLNGPACASLMMIQPRDSKAEVARATEQLRAVDSAASGAQYFW